MNIVFYSRMVSIKNAYLNFLPYTDCGDASFREGVQAFISIIDKVYSLTPIIIILSAIIMPFPFIVSMIIIFASCCSNLFGACDCDCDCFKKRSIVEDQSNYINNRDRNNVLANNNYVSESPNPITNNNPSDDFNNKSNNEEIKRDSLKDAPPIIGFENTNNNQGSIIYYFCRNNCFTVF